MNTPSDQEILNGISEGATKEKAFSQLVYKYQENLYWSIRRLTKSHEATDDVLQNCWIKVWKNIHKFQGNSSLYTWLYRIGTNEAYSYLSTAYKRTFVPTDEPLVSGSENLHLSGEKIEALLLKAIHELPEKQQIVFQMKYFDDLKFKEISEILGTSVGGLKASYHHAVKKIEAFIEGQLNH